MSINFAILGILSWKPSTGYEMKKMFQESSFMYWSGNNNQIYKALIELQEEGHVTGELIHQDSSPSKKVYTITEKGRNHLKEWVKSSPQAPEFKKPFLVQLAWSDLLDQEELDELLIQYEHELQDQLIMHREHNKRAHRSPDRSVRESLLWEMISDNITATYQHELNWIRTIRQQLLDIKLEEERNNMNYQVRHTRDQKYIELLSAANPLSTENDALDLVALCGEHGTHMLMIHYAALSQDFFDLKTRTAGHFIQKLVNYGIKTVAVIPQEMTQQGRFREMALETNKGVHFRMYGDKDEAETWLLS